MSTKYWVAFSAIEQLDSTFIQRLYNYFGDIETAFKATLDDLKQIEGLSVKKAENFINKKKNIDADKALEDVLRRKIKIITFDSPKYPYMLSQIPNPPMTLFYKGDLESCNLEKTIAVVGSRKASLSGKDSIRRIVNDLKNTDICIVSGLAYGIDAAAHENALENNIKTIGVIGSGFDFKYPSGNKHLYDRIENGGGALITEYYPTFEALQFRFPQRNRIVTGLSYGTIVGEAALKSGALISANLTLDQGRELMCIPGAINNTNTEGIYKLLKNGATLVTSGEDVLNTLGWEIIKTKDNNLNKEENSLPLPQKLIFDIIGIEPKGFDEIQTETEMDTEELLMTLTTMELKGLIEQTEGDRYKRA